MRTFLLITGLLLLFAVEILRVYFIMPFPGSQQSNTIDLAYFIGRNIWLLRIAAILLLAYPVFHIFKQARIWKKITLAVVLVLYGVAAYMVNFVMEADKMFYQPTNKLFADAAANKVAADRLVLGVAINGEAKAYPIQFIGYHHQVADTVGNTPVIVTYCTVCRTGRVFSPEVNGKKETFRLVGMDHFNAMFEDATTKSWWRQATGMAIAGPLKGTSLKEIPSEQLSLGAWQRMYPNSLVMQPDTLFNDIYTKMASYDKGLSKGGLTRRDSGSWKPKSWVIGVADAGVSRAYDWNELVSTRLIQDSFPGGLSFLVTLENDTTSFHVYNRKLDGRVLQFTKHGTDGSFKDANTGSVWNADGKSVEGPFSGKQLQRIQAYQEFWHSWQTFHPETGKFRQ